MTTLPTLTVYSGDIPNRKAMTREEFAESVYQYLKYFDESFTPETNDLVEKTNTLSGEIQTAADNAKTSEDNAKTSENNAKNSELKAQKWAEEDEDVEVEDGAYSAKHWAKKAEGAVATLPEGTIDDSLIAEDKAWSSQKINSELNKKEDVTNKGVANGYAGLDENGKVPNEQLPDVGFKPLFEKKLFGGL